MELIKGKIIDPLEDMAAVKKVANVLDYFGTLRSLSTAPGSLCGGFSRGLMFPDTENLVFDSVDALERWFNSRLLPHNPRLNIQDCELAPRNILWLENGSICLLDWASAGYYPRLFEFCMQWILEGIEGNFNTLLLEQMRPLPDYEVAQREAVFWAWRNSQKYSL